jgi:folate-dependent phosphoribosylglycinamide formyltransferase PurN
MESGLRPRAIIVERTDRLAHLYGSYYRFRVGADFYERYENDPGPWYRPNGRSSFLLPTDAARQHGVKSHVVETMNGEEARSLVAHYSPDVCVLSGVGLINNLDEPRVGILNTHSGVLPTFRGLDNVAWSMLEGSPVGCSIHFVDAGVDTGPILATHALSEEECVAGVKLSLKYAKVRLLTEALRSIARGTPPRFEQAESAGRRFYRMHPLLRCVLAQRYERFGVSAFVGNMNWGDDV